MTPIDLDSRVCMGTDIEQERYPDCPKIDCTIYPKRQMIRVFLGNFGLMVRMSAPELNIVVEGRTQADVWTSFLHEVRDREDSAWLTFDVGPTRRDEIESGLNAPPEESWYEPNL